VVLGEECHIIQHEAGAASVIAGVQTRTIPAPEGVLSAGAVRGRLRRRDLHGPATSLICLENAHSSGRAVALGVMEEIRELASAWGLPVHLDGARIFNAALALGVDAREIARRADSVMFCLSKGLCAPVGSLLAGKRDFVEEARLRRKIMGGGMRQAGILAAAGILALTEQRVRLGEDHERARRLARGLAEIPRLGIDPGKVEINMVFFTFPGIAAAAASAGGAAPGKKPGGARVVELFRSRTILINPPDGGGEFRFVTHQGIGDEDITAVLARCREVFA
jgi:threonine aldolase